MKRLLALLLLLLLATPAAATLPSSGPISLNAVASELGVSATNFSLNDARTLCVVPTGPISLASCYGKSAYTPMIVTLTAPVTSDMVGFVDYTSITANYLSVTGGSGVSTVSYALISQVNTFAPNTLLTNIPATEADLHFQPNTVGVQATVTIQATVTDTTGHVVLSNTAAFAYTVN